MKTLNKKKEAQSYSCPWNLKRKGDVRGGSQGDCFPFNLTGKKNCHTFLFVAELEMTNVVNL